VAKKKNPKGTQARDYLERADTSVIDQQAKNAFNCFIPAEWVRNELKEDYGKDFLVDLAKRGGPVKECFFVQLKGTEVFSFVEDGKAITIRMEKRHLTYYANEVKLPVFLIVIDVKAKTGYWLFTQQYLATNLTWKETDTHSVRIPTTNKFPDNDKLADAVRRAMDWMVISQRKPLGEQVAERIRELQAKDSRVKVTLKYSELEELIRLDATEPIPLKLGLRPRSKRRLVRMRTDLLDRGVPVKFDPGEITIEGSALFSEMVAQGGTIQFRSSAKAQATLIVCDNQGQPIESWPGINGEIGGGQKELHFQSQLPRCPFNFKIGPLSKAGKGTVNFSVDPMAWDGQPLLLLAYFDKVESFFKKLVTHSHVRILLEIDGAAVLPVDGTMEDLDRYLPWVDLLELLRKARVVARELKLKPVWSLKNLDEFSAVQAIELVYGLLIDRQFELSPSDNLFEIPTPKSELKARTELKPGEVHKVTLADYGTTFQFFGEPVRFENVAWYFPSLELYSTNAELDQLAQEPGDDVLVRYRTTLGSRPIVRVLTDDEMRQLEERGGDQIPEASAGNDQSRSQLITLKPVGTKQSDQQPQ
jgi:hypothetical protein